MQPYSSSIDTVGGSALRNASVAVKLNGVLATIYDLDGVEQANPMTTDSTGSFSFRAANGEYTLEISRVGIVPRTETVQLYDSADDDTSTANLASDDGSKGAGLVGFSALAAYAAGTVGKWLADLKAAAGSALVGFIQSGTGAVARTVQDKLRESVSVKDFGAVCDGVTNDTAAVQAAVNYCLSFDRAKPLIIPGRCLITASLIVDRVVDSTLSEFRIIGDGDGAGFWTTDHVTIFDSTLAVTTDPRSEWLTFENIHFETSSVFNSSFVLSKKFLRTKFINCNFRLIRCVLSDVYVQTLHFIDCNIRNSPASFVNCVGMYDVTFNHCVIENGSTLVNSTDEIRGISGIRLIDCVIEGIQASIVVATGVNTMDLIGCHLEGNYSPEFNLFAGGKANGTITAIGNYIHNPAGATFYYGPTAKVVSQGNMATTSVLHANAAQVVDLVSIGDDCAGGVSDATRYSTLNGVYRAGAAEEAWAHSANHVTKDANGMFGFGRAPVGVVRAAFQGTDQSGGAYAAVAYDSLGNVILGCRNDRQLLAPGIAAGAGAALVMTAGGLIGQATKPSIAGSRGGNAALASLLSSLASMGIITDSTTA